MKTNNYFEQRNINNIKKLRELLAILPVFCREFFIGIEIRTSPLTRINYASDLKIFFLYLINNSRYFIGKEIDELDISDLEFVTSTDIEGFLSYLSLYELDGNFHKNNERGKARKLSAIRVLFKYFYNKNKLSKDIASKISMPKLHDKEIIRLEGNEVNEILELIESFNCLNSQHQNNYNRNTKVRDLAIITLLLGTGIRVSECVGLNNNDVDFTNNVFVVTRKGGNRSTIYFSDEIKKALNDYMDFKDKLPPTANESALFLSLQNKRISVRAIENIVKKYAKVISPLKKITPHKLRSTYGTNLYRATKDIYVVAEVLGHKDINTTKKHYAAISEDIKKAASAKVILRDNKID